MKALAPLLLAWLLAPMFCFGQDTLWKQKPDLHFGGFVDVFYAYDFNKPEDERQPFLYNHNRHNEFNLNLGYIKLELAHPKYRAALALQAGTYTNDNYAAEPVTLKHLFEARAGISLSRKNNLWLDVGIMPSYIGFETAVSIDNWTLGRSLLAENSPYFLSGAKLTYNPNGKWEVAAMVNNGWQRIQRVRGNSLPGFGTQIVYKPNDNATLNWSTFVGTDDPDSTRRMRYFNNFYGQFNLTPKVGLIAGFDIGVQQAEKASKDYQYWLSPVMILRYQFHARWAAALRGEYYHDPYGVIIPAVSANGFRTTGLSLNVDYRPIPFIACRIEGRWLHGTDAIFETHNGYSKENFTLLASMAVKLVR